MAPSAAQRRTVVLLAAVLALDSADIGTVGAVGGELKRSLEIDNTQLGLLATVVAAASALATLPAGVLADRVRRTDLLAGGVALWALAMAWSAVASSYAMLLASRLVLGLLVAVALPTIASLIGDSFPPSQRARGYGKVLTGELIGSGVGLVVGGNLAAVGSWRLAFGVLALPALALAVAIRRGLPEPPRTAARAAGENGNRARDDLASRLIAERGVRPVRRLVLRGDPARLSLPRAARYVLSIPTNLLLIAASSVGYLFFAGLRTFGVIFARGHFGLGQSVASTVFTIAGAGALAGVVLGGRAGDALLARGRLEGRVLVGVAGFVASAVILLPSLLVGSLWVAFPLYVLGAAAFSLPTAALDAARLDVVASPLWGRAEGVRAVVRTAAHAAGPLLFGVLADALAHGGSRAEGVRDAFLVMLVPLALNGAVLLPALRHYPRDVASALASERGGAAHTAASVSRRSGSAPRPRV